MTLSIQDDGESSDDGVKHYVMLNLFQYLSTFRQPLNPEILK